METEDERPRISVSAEIKVNLGNYESAGGSCVLSGLHEDATAEEIHRLLDTASMTFDLIQKRIEFKLGEYKAKR